MLRFKKCYTIRLISSLITVIFIINSAVYGKDLSIRINLRIPIQPKTTYPRMIEDMRANKQDSIEKTTFFIKVLESNNPKQELVKALTNVASKIVTKRDKESAAVSLDIFLSSLHADYSARKWRKVKTILHYTAE